MDQGSIDSGRQEELLRLFEEEMWLRGDLSYLLRKHGQTRIYRLIKTWKEQNPDKVGPLVINAHRGLGKSFFLILLALERAYARPNQEIIFASPTFRQTEEIARPLFATILKHCPEHLRPRKSGMRFTIKNPRWGDPEASSNIKLVSCKDDADAQRGLRSDLILLDECREIPNLKYVAGDVFLFHFVGRHEPLMVLSSTPPASPDHPWVRTYLEPARKDGRYIVIPTVENEDWTERDDDMLAAVLGGKNNSAWEREALCKIIGDESKLIIPEFQRLQGEVVVADYPRPSHFKPYMVIDTGWVDNTAVLFGFVDFLSQILVIEREIIFNKATTNELAIRILEMEDTFYARVPHPIERLADITPQQLDDLKREIRLMLPDGASYGIRPVDKSRKYDEDSAIAKLRAGIQVGRVRIHARCTQLIDQLLTGTRDEKGNFERSEVHGHYDGIAALKYLYRMADFRTCPFPEFVAPRNEMRSPVEPIKVRRRGVPIVRKVLNVIRRKVC